MVWWGSLLMAAQGHGISWYHYSWQWINFVLVVVVLFLVVWPRLKLAYEQRMKNLSQQAQQWQQELKSLEEEIQDLRQKIQTLKSGWQHSLKLAQEQIQRQQQLDWQQNQRKWELIIQSAQEDFEVQLRQLIKVSRKLMIEELFKKLDAELQSRTDLGQKWSLTSQVWSLAKEKIDLIHKGAS